MTVALPAPFAPSRAGTFGSRLAEFLVVGGITPLLFPLSWFLRRRFGLDASEFAIGFSAFYAAHVINDPHFTVTYILFYKDARRRAFSPDLGLGPRLRYIVAGVAVPIVLLGWSAVAIMTRSAEALGWMVQLMYLLVGWHYVKQGFGVLTVLSERRGVTVTALERRVLLAHAFAGWAFAWANPSSPAGEFEEKGVVYTALAHPRLLEVFAGLVLAASSVTLLAVLLAKWWRERRLLPLAPLSGFLVTIWAWTIYSSADPLVRYVVPALHSIQYLYFVWLMKRNEARAEEGAPSFRRPVAVRLGVLALSALALGWLLFHGAPEFLDTAFVPRARIGPMPALGQTPYLAALFVIVNIHHYFMDHVVWRRDNPDTRYLRATG